AQRQGSGGEKERAKRLFLLQVVQPGLAGLMDGSVSTLAPLFAAAFATRNSGAAFRVGLAASVGAGISMGFAEALSDDGSLTGRGKPLLRGVVCGLMKGDRSATAGEVAPPESTRFTPHPGPLPQGEREEKTALPNPGRAGAPRATAGGGAMLRRRSSSARKHGRSASSFEPATCPSN